MKQSVMLVLPLMICAQGSLSGYAADLPRPELVSVTAQQIYTPLGFDDNDNAQIVLQGRLLSTCYKVAAPKVSVNEATHEVFVTPQAYSYKAGMCLGMLVYYTQTVDLGILSAGQYRIVELDGTGKAIHETVLPIAQSKSLSPDEFLYAPVKQVRIEESSSGPVLVLTGTYSSNCMDMQEVKILHRAPHLVEVLPIASYKAGAACNDESRPFEVKMPLPEIEHGDALLHVRSLNGQAVNSIELF